MALNSSFSFIILSFTLYLNISRLLHCRISELSLLYSLIDCLNEGWWHDMCKWLLLLDALSLMSRFSLMLKLCLQSDLCILCRCVTRSTTASCLRGSILELYRYVVGVLRCSRNRVLMHPFCSICSSFNLVVP